MTKLFTPQSRVNALEVKVNGLDGFNLDRDILTLAKRVSASKEAVKKLVSAFLSLAFLSCFREEKGSRKALFGTRDKIESVLGAKYRRMFMRGVIHFDYAVPSMAALEAYDWYASEPKKAKKAPVFGIDALKAVIENRLKKVKENEGCEGTAEEFAKIALLLKSFDEPVKK